MTTTQHTQGRLVYLTGPAYNGNYHVGHSADDDEKLIFECYEGTEEEQEANARRLVHCWNNHDQLVEALSRIMKATPHSMCSDAEAWALGESAVKSATGE